jgi:acyl-CoA reductase-like NAD-dependent aldehyde dehydrogenase
MSTAQDRVLVHTSVSQDAILARLIRGVPRKLIAEQTGLSPWTINTLIEDMIHDRHCATVLELIGLVWAARVEERDAEIAGLKAELAGVALRHDRRRHDRRRTD